MPEGDCNKTITLREYDRKGDVRVLATISRRPRLAPDPRKTMAELRRELTAKVDAEIAARNARVPQCHPCDHVTTVEVARSERNRNFDHLWTERFELRDADGNVIRGTAQYACTGEARIETVIKHKFCDEPFGDDDSEFRKSMTPELVPFDLKQGWGLIPETDKSDLDLEFEKGKKK